jgi:hypothetical protein
MRQMARERAQRVHRGQVRPVVLPAVDPDGDPAARLNGLIQLTKGLSAIVKKAERAKAAA